MRRASVTYLAICSGLGVSDDGGNRKYEDEDTYKEGEYTRGIAGITVAKPERNEANPS